MKVEKLQKFGNKSGLMNCKWSSLNAPGTQSLVSHTGQKNSIFRSSWGIKEMGSGEWTWKNVKISDQNWLKGPQMVQFECPGPGHSIPCVSHRLGELHFPIFLGNKGNGHWGMKMKSCENFRTKSASRAANGPVWMPRALNPLCLTQVGNLDKNGLQFAHYRWLIGTGDASHLSKKFTLWFRHAFCT